MEVIVKELHRWVVVCAFFCSFNLVRKWPVTNSPYHLTYLIQDYNNHISSPQ